MVYRSRRKDLMYLYVDEAVGLARVPEALLLRFGKPEPALRLVLNAQRTLATEDVDVVMRNIHSNGYHLQMPPVVQHNTTDMHNHKKPLA